VSLSSIQRAADILAVDMAAAGTGGGGGETLAFYVTTSIKWPGSNNGLYFVQTDRHHATYRELTSFLRSVTPRVISIVKSDRTSFHTFNVFLHFKDPDPNVLFRFFDTRQANADHFGEMEDYFERRGHSGFLAGQALLVDRKTDIKKIGDDGFLSITVTGTVVEVFKRLAAFLYPQEGTSLDAGMNDVSQRVGADFIGMSAVGEKKNYHIIPFLRAVSEKSIEGRGIKNSELVRLRSKWTLVPEKKSCRRWFK
jgi:hypothetical protein